MTKPTPEDIARWKALAEKATRLRRECVTPVDCLRADRAAEELADVATEAVPRLIARVEALEAECARLRFPCRQCGKPCEPERYCYATPVCFACLPPPEPLPILVIWKGRTT